MAPTRTSGGLSPPADEERSGIGPPVIRGYDLVRELGRGGQGDVYEAFQKATHRTVALKTLRFGQYASDRDRLRFEREVDVIAHLRHPNIVTLYESGESGGHRYFAMEFVRGRPLDRYLADTRPGITRTVELFRKVSAAVAYAHRHGVVHRDLKPRNVLVDGDGEPHVLDFGLARGGGRAFLTDGRPVTVTGEFMGTLAYAAPEQFSDSAHIDTPADVYALGVMLYEALTGRQPHDSSVDFTTLLHSVQEKDPCHPRTLRPEIERDLETIILRCLDRDATRRYPAAADLADDLGRFLEGKPILAKRDRPVYVAYKKASRVAGRHPLGTCILMALVAWGVAEHLLRTGRVVRHADRLYQSAVQPLIRHVGGSDWSDEVVVIALDDATVHEIEHLAHAFGLEDVNANVVTWRRLHGFLMKQLARARPRVVAWDIIFASDQPVYDSDWAAGARMLKEAGTKVVVGARTLNEQSVPQLSRAVLETADAWGWVLFVRASGRVRGPWLFVDHPLHSMSFSLSMASYLQARHPDVVPHVVWDALSLQVQVRYARPRKSGDQDVRWLPEWDILNIAGVSENESEGLPPGSDATDRRVAVAWSIIPSPEILKSHTESYRDVLAMDEVRLRERFADKIIVIGETRLTTTDKPDRDVLDEGTSGREEFFCYMHAAAINDLLQKVYAHHPGGLGESILLMTGAATGTIVGFLPGRRRRVLWVMVGGLLLAGITVCGGMLAAAAMSVVISPASIIVAVWLAAAGAAWVRRAWERHRDRQGGRATSQASPAALA